MEKTPSAEQFETLEEYRILKKIFKHNPRDTRRNVGRPAMRWRKSVTYAIEKEWPNGPLQFLFFLMMMMMMMMVVVVVVVTTTT
jgi:hypothetical protein